MRLALLFTRIRNALPYVRWQISSYAAECVAVKKGKGFPLQARSGSWDSRKLKLLDLLDFRHYESGKVVVTLHPLEFSWCSFSEAEPTPGHMVPSVPSEKIPSDTTGDRSRDLPTSSAVP